MSTKDQGKWFKALKPGTLVGGKFIKAGDIFQLGEEDVFSDNWMEEHEAPPAVQAAQTSEEVESEQKEAVRKHEEADALRRGKFTTPSVPRSPEHQKKIDDERKAQAKAAREKAQAERNPPAIDRGSRSPAAPGGVHETSNNPSRVDENAMRKG